MALVQKEIKKVYLGSTLVRPIWWEWNDLDISTATLSEQFYLWYWYQWLYINPNEDVAITSSHGSPWVIRWYTYTNKDISTAVLEWTKNPVRYIHCVCGNNDWTHIYFWTHNDNTIYEYSTTNRSVANMTSYKSKDFWVICQCVWVNKTEKYIVIWWVNGSWTWWELYEMSTPWDVTTATLLNSWTLSYNLHGLFFNDSMTKCIACEYSASSWTVHQYDCDLLNSSSMTQTHTFWPVWFTIWYANVTEDWTKMYAAKESWYIYEYTFN